MLITGATGFVGRSLVSAFVNNSGTVRVATRSRVGGWPVHVVEVSGCDLVCGTNWAQAVADQECVVHCAAMADGISGHQNASLQMFREVNAVGTLKVARLAAKAGVRRFVFLSTVKVNGESTTGRAAFNENDTPLPEDAYGRSKWEAELGLQALARETGMEIVIVRCPLVYGPGVKGNFRNLMRLADSPWPLPLKGISNARSFVYIGNLVNFLAHASVAPEAANKTFMVSDEDSVSTPDLVRILRGALGRPTRLWSFPWAWGRILARAVGKESVVTRLLGSLEVDITKARTELNWRPPFSNKESLSETIRAGRKPANGRE